MPAELQDPAHAQAKAELPILDQCLQSQHRFAVLAPGPRSIVTRACRTVVPRPTRTVAVVHPQAVLAQVLSAHRSKLPTMAVATPLVAIHLVTKLLALLRPTQHTHVLAALWALLTAVHQAVVAAMLVAPWRFNSHQAQTVTLVAKDSSSSAAADPKARTTATALKAGAASS